MILEETSLKELDKMKEKLHVEINFLLNIFKVLCLSQEFRHCKNISNFSGVFMFFF